MRSRTTWIEPKKATLHMADDPMSMDKEHMKAQPADDKYGIGDSSTFAEDVASPEEWRQEYSGGQVKREEVGLPSFRADSLKEASVSEAIDLHRKAGLALRIANSIFKNADEATLEAQASAFTRFLPNEELLSLATRLAADEEEDCDDDKEDCDDDAKEQSKEAAQQQSKDDKKSDDDKSGEQPPWLKKKDDGEGDDDKKEQSKEAAVAKLFADFQRKAQAQQQQFAQQVQQMLGQGQQQPQVPAMGQQQQQVPAMGQQQQQQMAQQDQMLAQQQQQMAQQDQQMPSMAQEQADLDQLLAQEMIQDQMPSMGMDQQDSMFADDGGMGVQFDAPMMDLTVPQFAPGEEQFLMAMQANTKEYQQAAKASQYSREASSRYIGTKPEGAPSRIASVPGTRTASAADREFEVLQSMWKSAPNVSSAYK